MSASIKQNKGQQACVAAFLAAIGGGSRHGAGAGVPTPPSTRAPSAPGAPIPFEEIMEVSRVAIEAAGMARG